MVALPNKIYMLVAKKKAHWQFTANELPAWNADDVLVIDITGVLPTPQVGWAYDGTQFIAPSAPPAFNLAAAKLAKLTQLNNAYDQANTGTFQYLGVTYNGDTIAQTNFNSIANYINNFNAFPANFPMAWLAADGSILPLPSVADFWPLYQAFVAQGVYNINHFVALKTQVLSLPTTATQASLDAIVW